MTSESGSRWGQMGMTPMWLPSIQSWPRPWSIVVAARRAPNPGASLRREGRSAVAASPSQSALCGTDAPAWGRGVSAYSRQLALNPRHGGVHGARRGTKQVVSHAHTLPVAVEISPRINPRRYVCASPRCRGPAGRRGRPGTPSCPAGRGSCPVGCGSCSSQNSWPVVSRPAG